MIAIRIPLNVARWLYSMIEWKLLGSNPTPPKHKLSKTLKQQLEALFDTLAFLITTEAP